MNELQQALTDSIVELTFKHRPVILATWSGSLVPKSMTIGENEVLNVIDGTLDKVDFDDIDEWVLVKPITENDLSMTSLWNSVEH